MGVAASIVPGFAVGGPDVGGAGVVMPVVGDGGDVAKRIRIHMRAGLARVPATLDHMVDVRDDAAGHEQLPVLIPINAPLVGTALGEDLEGLLRRMKSPDGGVDDDSLLLRRAGLADLRRVEDAMTPIEPAIGSPVEAVEGFMGVVEGEAVEEHFRLAGLVAFEDGDEQEFRGLPDPHAAEAVFQTR